MAQRNEQTETARVSESAPTAPAQTVADDGLVDVRELARRAGLIKPVRLTVNGKKEVVSGLYRAAAYLHGWNQAQAVRLSEEAFKGAIEAARKPTEKGAYAPHADALAPHLRSSR
jgi:hypothetical protein